MEVTAGKAATDVDRPGALRLLPGLDGLRALAVTAVIVYHLNASWLRGGFLGVDVFFVISGYLITSLLLADRARSGISLVAFWKRRARRLLPALFALLGGVTLLASIFARDSLGRLRQDVPASLGYVMNWHLLVQHAPYAASLGRPPLLLHLWSLSVEEQFYLVWPVALILLSRRVRSGQIAMFALFGALVSAGLMAGMYSSGDPSAVYFGTETHAEGILIGCALAAAIPPWRMTASVAPRVGPVLDRAGAAALAVLIAGLATLGFYSPFTYRGGMLLVDLATAALIALAAHPASLVGPLLSLQPLRWLGLRSYSLYLWHWPIFELTRPGVDLSWTGWPVVVLRLGLTAAAAEASYRWVEQPWRTGAAQARLRRWLSVERPRVRLARAVTPIVPLAVVAALLAYAPASSLPAVLMQGSTPAARVVPGVPASEPSRQGPAPVQPEALAAVETIVAGPLVHGNLQAALISLHRKAPVRSGTLVRAPLRAGPAPRGESPILALGDSVLLAASPALTRTFGSEITIDAQVGRQVSAGLARLRQYRTSGALKRYRAVIIDLGTNGAFMPAQFAQMAQLLRGVPHVVVFNVHAARPWVPTSNATLVAGVRAHATQMVLVNWNHAATGRALLYSDGVHPDPSGAQLYSRLLLSALRASARPPS